MEGTGKIAAAVIIAAIVIVGGFAVFNSGMFKLTPNSVTPNPQQTVTQTTSSGQVVTTAVTPQSWPTVSSAVEFQVNDRDALANSALTEGTNIQTDYWWSQNGQTFNFLGAAGTTTPFKADFNMNPQMNGIVYIRTQIVSGQTYYISPMWTQQNNQCITGYDFMDITNAGTPQWLFQCTLSKTGVSPAPNSNAAGGGAQIPLVTYYAMAIAYTKPTANSNSAATGTQSTNANSLAQILYVLTDSNNKGAAISQIELKANGTNNSKWNAGQSVLLLPTESMTGAVTTTSLNFNGAQQNYQDGTNWHYVWTFNAPIDTTFGVTGASQNNNLKGAYMYFVNNSGFPAQIPFTVNLYTNYAATDHLDWTMTWTIVTPSQGTDTVSKTIAISADGSTS